MRERNERRERKRREKEKRGMSSVIVLSDSDVEANGIESEMNGEYRSDATSDFDLPEVPFCREIAGNSRSESSSDSNVDNGCERKATSREERAKRRQPLAWEKALKTAERKTSRGTKPGEGVKFMEVNLDRGIDAVVSRGEIENALQNAGIKFNVTTELIPNSITWRRYVEEDYVARDEDNEIRTKRSVQTEKYAIVIWNSYEAVRHIAEDTFCTSVSSSKDLIPNYNMTLVIYGIEEYFLYRKKQQSNQKPGSKGSKCNSQGNQRFDTLPIISRQQLEMCLAEIQIVTKCSSRLIENAQDLALMVCKYTKSISEIPYKLQKRGNQEGKFDWYVMGNNKNTVCVDKNGNGLKRLWQQQLCQFNLSSLETSEAICTKYPSPMQLVKVSSLIKQSYIILENLFLLSLLNSKLNIIFLCF